MFKVGDKVRVLPNKKDGIITHIVDKFWLILDNEQSRPYRLNLCRGAKWLVIYHI